MASQTVVMPQLGESVMEGIVVKWLVQPGDHVNVDDLLCEVETEKANTEVPSPVEGYIAALVAEINETIEVGHALVEISEEPVEGVAPSPKAADPAPTQSGSNGSAPASTPPLAQSNSFEAPSSTIPTSPSLKPPQPTTLSHGASKGSWQQHMTSLTSRTTTTRPAEAPAPAASKPAAKKSDRWEPFGFPSGGKAYRYPQPRVQDGDKVEKFSRRRQIIAEHMVVSQAVSPHVVTVAEVDMTEVVKLRAANKVRLRKQGINVTYLAFVLKATVEALGEFPGFNAVVGDGEVIIKGRIHLGCAVETPAGLVVPVLRDADQYNLIGLANNLDRLAQKARDNNLDPDDVSGGTFTVSNPGLKGNLYGGAIINQPQVGILRMGEIKKRPMVITQNGQDVIAIRNMMYIALSYDHRVIDGVTGNAYLYRVRELLEQAKFQL